MVAAVLLRVTVGLHAPRLRAPSSAPPPSSSERPRPGRPARYHPSSPQPAAPRCEEKGKVTELIDLDGERLGILPWAGVSARGRFLSKFTAPHRKSSERPRMAALGGDDFGHASRKAEGGRELEVGWCWATQNSGGLVCNLQARQQQRRTAGAPRGCLPARARGTRRW
jgi:hypothetical protein